MSGGAVALQPAATVDVGVRPGLLLAAVVAVALVVRVLLIAVGSEPELYEYDRLARNVVAGHGYVVPFLGTDYASFYGGIFYVGLTAALYALFPPGPLAVAIAQALIGAALVGLVFQLGRTLAGPRVATLAAVLTALHPGLVYYDARKLHPLSFDTALGVLSVLALLRASRRRRAGAALAAGVVLGAAVLQRGSLVLLVPVALVWLWALGPRDRRTLVTIGACAAGVAMAMGPWVARNYAIHGRPIMLTTSAEHFWLGNAPHSYGSNLLPDGRTVFEAAPAEFRDAVLSRNEWGQHELFWKTALDDAKAHPGRFLGGLARKFLLFWSFGLQSGILYPRLYLVLYGAFYAPMLALAVFGAARLIRTSSVETRAAAMLLVVTCVSVSLVQSVFYVDLRHRWGIEPLLLVLAASGALAARPRPASGEAGG